MFNVFNRPSHRYPSIRQALVASGLPTASDPNQIGVVESRGLFSGRHVNFFRAYQAGGAILVRTYADLDARPDAVLGSGHVEHDGLVVINARREAEYTLPARVAADRAAHADDQRLVFWDAEAAQSMETTLSAPAATWLQARSKS